MDLGNFFQVPVNYFAVLLCGIANMAIGFLWYGPIFGKQWMALVGLTPEKMAKSKKEMPKKYTLMFLTSLLTAYVLFHFIWYAAPGSYTLFIAIKTALWGWIGFVIPVNVSKFLFTPDRKPIRLLFIETGYYFAALIVMSSIFYFVR